MIAVILPRVDRLPQIDIDFERLLDATAADVGTIHAPDADSALIEILDCGITMRTPY